MRKTGLALLFLLAAALVSALPVRAEDEKKFEVTGEVRARWDYSENTFDFSDATDDTVEFFPYRVNLGVHATLSDYVSANVEVQNFGFFGNVSPERPAGPIGQGLEDVSQDSSTELYQGNLQIDELWETGFGLRVGRQEHTLGNELHMGDNDFYNGLSFDGLRVMWDNEKIDLNLFYYIVDEEAGTAPPPATNVNFEDQRELWGATAGFALADGKHRFEPYLLNIRNTTNGAGRERLMTLGLLYQHPWSEDSAFDWSAEFAMQNGEIGADPSCVGTDCDVAGWIAEGEFGWTLAERHRFHVGLLSASGDDNGTDGDIDGFRPLFPDLHANNRLGNLDTTSLTDITDVNAGYGWMGEKNKLMAAVHHLMLSEDTTLVGPPADTSDDLGDEVDVTWQHTYSDIVGFEVGVANLFPGDVQDDTAAGDADDALRGWVQFQLKWN